mmetsp:Transcript_10770/g.66476  ORF Transcript_10770/g.66476 Transcript_10770/m.66476 type:complete len:138 (+) Transcript_10770:224-637(+)
MQDRDSLPFLQQPHDTLRQGLPTLKEDATLSHPVEEMLRERTKREKEEYLSSLRDIYGTALPASLEIEGHLLDRAKRFPGAVTSNIGLEARMGTLDQLSPDDFAELPVRSEVAPPSLHELMEKRHGISKQPAARAMF